MVAFGMHRGLTGPEESSSEDEGDEEDAEQGAIPEDSEEVANLTEWGVGALAANPDEDIPLADETRRLAVVDLGGFANAAAQQHVATA